MYIYINIYSKIHVRTFEIECRALSIAMLGFFDTM